MLPGKVIIKNEKYSENIYTRLLSFLGFNVQVSVGNIASCIDEQQMFPNSVEVLPESDDVSAQDAPSDSR